MTKLKHMLLIAVLATVPRLAAQPTRTVLYNGDIFTAVPGAPHVQAIAIEGDRIIAAGGNWPVLALATPGTKTINLGGRTVIPGFNDAHVHVIVPQGVYVNSNAFVPGPGPTLSEMQALIGQAAAANPPGTLLLGLYGTAMLDDPGTNRFAFDGVAPANPVVLFAWSGHGTVFNTQAMQLLEFAPNQPDPTGGVFERLPNSNILSGVAHEYAEFLIRRRLLSLLPDAALVGAYQAYAAQASKFGVTSIQDMAVGLTQQRALAAIGAASLPLRVRSICFPLDLGEPCATWNDTEMVRAAGTKWITDGTPIERRAFVGTAYADRPGQFGAFNFTNGQFIARLLAQRIGLPARSQILLHTVGDAAIGNVLDGLEATGGRAVWSNRRPRVEHGDLLFPPDYGRVAKLGVVIVQNGTHLALTSIFAVRFQPQVFAQLEPLQSLLTNGIPLGLGTDSIGSPISPFVDLLFVTTHPTHPSEALSMEQAVTAYTRGSAYAEFEEYHKGTLAPGNLADLAVLSQDIFTVPPPALPATISVLTIVGGQVVWDAGVL
ncbi:MAG TPA: amidohydrolase family protein [Bryobacteraceae bacterium]|nr:amidohydrolase family protein [Bryobacteraceae bacterium]